jgi:hypothetical protein
MTNVTDDGSRLIEFVCDRCLHAVRASDTGRWPRCPRCGIKLTPDSDDPPRVGPPQATVGRMRRRPPHQAQAKVDAA